MIRDDLAGKDDIKFLFPLFKITRFLDGCYVKMLSLTDETGIGKWKYFYISKTNNYLISTTENALCFNSKLEAVEWIEKNSPK